MRHVFLGETRNPEYGDTNNTCILICHPGDPPVGWKILYFVNKRLIRHPGERGDSRILVRCKDSGYTLPFPLVANQNDGEQHLLYSIVPPLRWPSQIRIHKRQMYEFRLFLQ